VAGFGVGLLVWLSIVTPSGSKVLQRGGLPVEALLLVACPVSPVWFWWQHQSPVAGVTGAIINAAMFAGLCAVWRPALLRGAARVLVSVVAIAYWLNAAMWIAVAGWGQP